MKWVTDVAPTGISLAEAGAEPHLVIIVNVDI